MILLFDVLHYHFVSHVAAAAAEVSSRPNVPAPELLAKVRELLQKLISRLPFQPLQQSADRNLWWYAHEQMNVVTRNMPFHYRNFVACTDFSNQVSDSEANFTCQRRATILCCPDQVQMNLEYGVSATTVIFHAATLARQKNLLKPSPKGEGFDPPRVRQ
jgi:hypothetical protein